MPPVAVPHAALPVGVLFKAGEAGLVRDSVIHCGHVYTVDKARLNKRIGTLSSQRSLELNRAFECSLGL
jgi:mRNA-degrading endonuclease toxin of MazEF toxin-antitoxin module